MFKGGVREEGVVGCFNEFPQVLFELVVEMEGGGLVLDEEGGGGGEPLGVEGEERGEVRGGGGRGGELGDEEGEEHEEGGLVQGEQELGEGLRGQPGGEELQFLLGQGFLGEVGGVEADVAERSKLGEVFHG